MTHFYHFDQTHWPIVVLTISGSPEDDADMRAFLTAWQELYIVSMQKNERYKLIFDSRKAGVVKFNHLRAMGEWLSKIKNLTETWMDRTAIIVSNPTIKLLIQFVFTIYKAVRPFKVFHESCLEKAFLWVNSDEEGDETESNESISISDLQLGTNIDFSG